jgi:hypothetical protein
MNPRDLFTAVQPFAYKGGIRDDHVNWQNPGPYILGQIQKMIDGLKVYLYWNPPKLSKRIKRWARAKSPASYFWDQDSIICPPWTHFETTQDFLSTAFHELAHATGAGHRLNRPYWTEFGKRVWHKENNGYRRLTADRLGLRDLYGSEECVAELASFMVCRHYHIDTSVRSAQYVQMYKGNTTETWQELIDSAEIATQYLLQCAAGSP